MGIRFDTQRLAADMAARGWLKSDLSARADVSPMTVGRFLRGEFQTSRVAAKLAKALGYSVRRYLLVAHVVSVGRPAPGVKSIRITE